MRDLRGIGASLRAAFLPASDPLPKPPRSRSFSEAVERLNREASDLVQEAKDRAPPSLRNALDDLTTRR